MPVTSVTSAPTTSFTDIASASSGAVRTAKKALGQEDFLKLLATQFQAQDPMKPMEDTAFIAQMAQFSSLEQSSAMSKDIALLRADQTLLTANSYIGRNVTVEDAKGDPVTGLVTGLDNDPVDGVTLTIDGISYPLASVRRIESAGTLFPDPATLPAA
ncbi:MAG: flagellar hook capping FlgD N-terminal domain-containing protein [Lacunisphaera sp.]|nr:flagellar hook capping FlgD N-terminal domain-containing protein [Lacunisphaera sp.]